MSGKNEAGTKNGILTVALETGETVLAKKEKGEISPLKYSNETQARAKVEAIGDQLQERGWSASVIRNGNRFLVLVYKVQYAGDEWPVEIQEWDESTANSYVAKRQLKRLSDNFRTEGLSITLAVPDDETGVEFEVPMSEAVAAAAVAGSLGALIGKKARVRRSEKGVQNPAPVQGPGTGKIFATPSGVGTRFTPRNRHNHPWSSDRKYEYKD